MDIQSKLNRRRFITLSLIGAGGVCLLGRCANPTLAAYRFLTNEESKLLDELVEQIISTDGWPGEKDACVTNFIDKLLVGPYTRYQ